MKDKLTNIQLWIHNHYDGIKLTLAVSTLFILLIGLYYQGFALQRQSEQTQAAVKSTQETTEALNRFTRGVGNAVDDIKEDSRNNTIILCTIILRGSNLELNDEDASEIQRICEEEVQRIVDERNNEQDNPAQPNIQNQDGAQSNNQPQNPPQANQPQPEPEPEPEEESFLAPVTNPIRDLSCNTLGLFCRNP